MLNRSQEPLIESVLLVVEERAILFCAWHALIIHSRSLNTFCHPIIHWLVSKIFDVNGIDHHMIHSMNTKPV